MDFVYVFIAILLVLILIVLLYISQKEPKAVTAQPRIIVVENTTKTDNTITRNTNTNTYTDVPVYPKHAPLYSNSHTPLDYQQLGILTADEQDKDPIILPLFGRKIYGRSDRYQYYTATDKNNMIRLPLAIDNRNCEDTVGCNEIYSGDKIYIPVYQGRAFTATIYKVDAPRYFASNY
jgi:hypothetical protein